MKISKKTLIMGAYILSGIGILWLLAVGIQKLRKPKPTAIDEDHALDYALQVGLIAKQAAEEGRTITPAEQKEVDLLLKMIGDLGFKFHQEGTEVGVIPK